MLTFKGVNDSMLGFAFRCEAVALPRRISGSLPLGSALVRMNERASPNGGHCPKSCCTYRGAAEPRLTSIGKVVLPRQTF